MKLHAFFVLSAALSLFAACAPSESAPVTQQSVTVASDADCASPETGLIKPESPGLPDERLTGPILVKSLMIGVDPANPQAFGSLLWSKGNAWFAINQFKGPFYLAAGETLSAETGKSAWITIYYGCRLQ